MKKILRLLLCSFSDSPKSGKSGGLFDGAVVGFAVLGATVVFSLKQNKYV